MKSIVCLATSPWHPIPTRKQQVMSRIPDAEILYFDPAATVIAPLRDPRAKPLMRAYKNPGEQVRDNITAYALPPVLPLYYRVRAINRLNEKRAAAYIRGKMTEHGLDKPLLWVYSPLCADVADRIPHAGLVYDCVDRHSAYGGLMKPALVDAMELELARKADVVFATAEALADRLRAANPRTYFIPNGADFERFAQAAQPQPMPEDMKNIPGPVFGFVGALQTCIQYDYVEYAAKARPDWSFVWIGKEKPGVELSGLRALKNVHFLGIKPNAELPRYLAHFDACLNLFAAGELSKDVSPLKFYEYLATGKPIVSTRQPDQIVQYAPLIEIADSPEGFVSACENALNEDPARAALRMEEGRRSSWDSRVAEMRQILKREGVFA